MPIDIAAVFGISERDFQIYRLLNAYGAMPASTLATRLKMNRTTVFSALKRLAEKGLVYANPKKSGTLFAAVEPEQILRQRQDDLRREEALIAKLAEATAKLSQEKGLSRNKPSVAFFEGEEGVISLFESTLALSKKQEAFLTLEKIPPRILHYLQGDFIAAKKKQGVFSRVLIPEGERAHKYRALDQAGNRETRLVKAEAPFETEIIIAGTHVALVDFESPCIGVLIESPRIAATMHAVFALVWNAQEK